MAQTGREMDARAVAARFWYRHSTRRQHHRSSVDLASSRLDAPACGCWREARQRRVPSELNAAPPGQLDQPVAHVPRATRDRKQLTGPLLKCEWGAHVAFEELALPNKGPRPQHSAEEMDRRIGNESVGFKRNGENVAPAAAADQDLAPAVSRPLDDGNRGSLRGEYCSHKPRGTGTDYDGGGHDSICAALRKYGHLYQQAMEGYAGA